MSKTTVEIEQSTADEITQWVSGIRSYASPGAAADWLEAVNMNPPNGGSGELIPIPDQVPGFDGVIAMEWDWDERPGITLDTEKYGGICLNKIVIISFVAKGPLDSTSAMISAIGFPSPNMGNSISLCLSRQPGVLYEPPPFFSDGYSPTLNYCVGPPPNSWTGRLEDGVQYFINAAGRKNVAAGKPQGELSCVPDGGMYYDPSGAACNFRVQVQKPTGH